MSLINIKDLSFYYDGSHEMIFDHASFQIDTRWKLGLTGRNGRGKTTLCRIFMGQLEYQGEISSSVEFEYFPFTVENMERTTAEVMHGICPQAEEWEMARELGLLSVDENVAARAFSTLSNGERTKVMLAALFLRDGGFLLIDEPTNHLDLAGRETVSRYLRRKQGFLLISHDRAFLDGCVDHVLSINRGSIEIQQGSFSSWLYNRELQDKFLLSKNEKLGKEIKRLEKAAAEKAEWSDKVERTKYATKNSGLRPDRGYIGHKSAKMMSRAKAIEGRSQTAIEEKTGLLTDVERAMPLKLEQMAYRSEKLLDLRDISVIRGGRKVCSGISFTVERGDRIVLRGINGSGKSSLLKLICGEEIEHEGVLERPGDLVISYLPQDAEKLTGTLRDYAGKQRIDESMLKTVLHYLALPRKLFELDMAEFSAGQKKKVLLAESLCRPAHLYVWDEPLNYIDLISRMQIEQLLQDYKQTMILVEHDAAFCEKIATKTVEL